MKFDKDNASFVTGSRAYGTPREDSDIDLVVLVSYNDLDKLNSMAETVTNAERAPSDHTGGLSSGSFRFGKLNLIAVTDKEAFEIWRDGTAFLKTKAPVDRDRAIRYFRKQREKKK